MNIDPAALTAFVAGGFWWISHSASSRLTRAVAGLTAMMLVAVAVYLEASG